MDKDVIKGCNDISNDVDDTNQLSDKQIEKMIILLITIQLKNHFSNMCMVSVTDSTQ